MLGVYSELLDQAFNGEKSVTCSNTTFYRQFTETNGFELVQIVGPGHDRAHALIEFEQLIRDAFEVIHAA